MGAEASHASALLYPEGPVREMHPSRVAGRYVFSFKGRVMIHYSCDRCKRSLDAEDDLRYVVRIEICAALQPFPVDETEDDRDHLLEIQEILERLDDQESDEIGEDVYQRRRFDLCADCYRQYVQNPLGRELAQFGFSSN